jgi:hypothetical protein
MNVPILALFIHLLTALASNYDQPAQIPEKISPPTNKENAIKILDEHLGIKHDD